MKLYKVLEPESLIRESSDYAIVARFFRLPHEIFVAYPNIDFVEIRERNQAFSLMTGFIFSGYLYTIEEYNNVVEEKLNAKAIQTKLPLDSF